MAKANDLFTLPAFMLLRKSRADEEEEKKAKAEGRVLDVLRTHRAILCDLAGKDGATISYVCEELLSGERLAARPDFQRFLAHLRSLPKPGGILYTIHAERITRGLLSERGMVQDLFIAQQILIREPGGITNLDNADERLLFEVKGSLAHHYLGRYKERVALTRTQQVREAKVRNGSVPFGYKWDVRTKQPTPDPVNFPILLACCREAFTTSAHALAAKYGVPQPHIHRALTSPFICGYPAKTTTQTILPSGTVKISYLPRELWIWPEQQGDYPRAMEREDWERLQQVIAARRKGGRGRARENHWCRDVVRINGHAVRLGTYSGWGGKLPTYEAPGARVFIARTQVHAAVTADLARIFTDPECVLRQVRAALRQPTTTSDSGALESKRDGLRAELAGLERRAALLEGERLAALESASRAVAQELEEVKRRLAAANHQSPSLTGAEAQMVSRVAVVLARDFVAGWAAFRDEEKRSFVRLLIEKVEVTCEKVGKNYVRTVSATPKGWLAAERGA